jgi:NADH:ubiquinone oxidoreductase subunit 6 (subunit J)
MFIFKFLIFLAFIVFTLSIPSLAVFFMLFYFLMSSIILYHFDLPFLSYLILIVYVGAVAMLFVFCTMLFERNTPLSGYFSARKFAISTLFCLFLVSFFFIFSPLFESKNSQQFLLGIKYVANADVEIYEYTTSTFLEVFSTFFFTTNLGLFYTSLIGFLLFFFTIAVTYVFFFTKKLS